MTVLRKTKKKRSIYFSEELVEQIEAEAKRQGRSFSWIVQRAFMIARDQLAKFPDDPSRGGDQDG